MDQRAESGSLDFHTDSAVRSADPFPHLTLPAILSQDTADRVLEWLRTSAPWRLRTESFYEQHEFSLLSEDSSPTTRALIDESVIETIRTLVRGNFEIAGELELVDVSAHRLTPNQTIRIHNDSIDGEETHRVLIQLNDGWSVDKGGLLMLFGSQAPEDVRAVFEPSHGSAFAFEISERSYHAVSTIRCGERFTLVYTFRDRG
jgi:Rps23 Pro-64 3,4-dihydroxylase Tpa1-like proline 4-hydroxylase